MYYAQYYDIYDYICVCVYTFALAPASASVCVFTSIQKCKPSKV